MCKATKENARIHGYDTVRGFSVISMIGFHACYDLAYLYGVKLNWFVSPLQDIWRASISWVFLLLAGIMCSYSRNNLRRAAKYLAVALAIYVVTSAVAVDTPISYGIIYCMGASTLVIGVANRLQRKSSPARDGMIVAGITLLLALFLLSLGIPTGTFGLGTFGGPCVRVPAALYRSGALSWLGFPGPHFASGDYYPPLPYTLLFLAGSLTGTLTREHGVPKRIASLTCKPLEWVGRRALPIYVLHQPVVLVVLTLVFGR